MITAIAGGDKSGSPGHAKRIASLFQMVGLSSLQPLRSCIYNLAGGLGSNFGDSSPRRGIRRGDPSMQFVFVVTKCASGSSSCCRTQRCWSNNAGDRRLLPQPLAPGFLSGGAITISVVLGNATLSMLMTHCGPVHGRQLKPVLREPSPHASARALTAPAW